MNRGVSIAKWNDHVANEDSFYSSDTCIAVSDGAGGCGLFADEWSHYLIEQLPKNNLSRLLQNLTNGWMASGNHFIMSMRKRQNEGMAFF